MRKHLYTFLALAFASPLLYAAGDIEDPISAFEKMAHLSVGSTIYYWKSDVNGDGKKEMFLIIGTDYEHQEKRSNYKDVPSWCVYLANTNGSGYQLSRGTKEPEFGPDIGPALPQIDPEKMYIGFISQLGCSGIVTVQKGYTRDRTAIAHINAYTIEGDHLKETQLVEYDPTKGKNPIYEQYLSKERRTTVKLEKITVP